MRSSTPRRSPRSPGARGRSSTAPSKAAVVQFSKSAAIDLAPHGIRVNCIAPGHIPTGITNYDLGSVIQHDAAAAAPRLDPTDVAEAVLYLVSDRSAQITGIVHADRRRHQRRAAGHPAARPHARREGRRRGASSSAKAARRRAMSADIVIRGGTVVDGTGAAPVARRRRGQPTVRITEIGTDLRGDRELDADGLRRRPRVHRHPHALRRAGVLGPAAPAVVVAGRHDRRRRQLRLHHRAHPPRAPRRDRRARSRTSRTWTRDRSPRASCGTSAPTPSTSSWSVDAAPSINFTAYVGHSSVRLFVMGDDAYERAATADEIDEMARLVRRGDRRRRRRVLHQLRLHAPRDGREAGAEPLRRARRGRGAVPRRRQHRQGRRARHRGRAVHLRRHVRVPAAHRPAVHLSAVRARRTTATARSSRCTTRPRSPGACRCGRRSRPGRSPCSSRWTARSAST